MKNLIDLMNENGSNQLLIVQAKDLKEFAELLLKERDQVLRDSQNEKYLSSKGVKELLDIKNTTLSTYEKQGLLRPYRIGGRKIYKKSEIVKILEASRYYI